MNKKWIAFLEEVAEKIEFLEKIKQCDVIFFRGHSNASYKLLPTLFRNKKINHSYAETALFYDFVSMAGAKIKNEDSWEILFNMRHHGCQLGF